MSLIDLLAFGPGGWGSQILRGTAMTLLIAVLGFLGGNLVGMLLAGARLTGHPLLAWPALVYTTVVRGVPELLVLYLLFFGGGELFRLIGTVMGYGGSSSADAFGSGVAAIALISGAYSAEVFRGALRAIPPGQAEAARAFGMRRLQLFRLVLLPQLLRYALPSLGNVWQLTLKDTALISVTGLVELMRITDIAAGSTRMPFLFYSVAILIFLGLTGFSNLAFERAERHFERGSTRGRRA